MTRSRLRKLRRIAANKTRTRAKRVLWSAAPIASALLSCIPAAARADDTPAADSGGLAEVVVTAQKRTENIQDVPISIQAFGTEKLEQMNVSSFDDYAKMIPSLSFQSQTGPSSEHTYMRGIASGGDGNHSGSQPSVGMYMDEQPVTTIDGNLNLHIYDIQRIEALSGPQGTLYGASSESGTIRIITNKPDPKAFAAGYDVEGNSVTHGGDGYKFEGFVNIPLSDVLAVRLVGWDEKDAGYINLAPGTATFTGGGADITANAIVKEHANTIETKGGRAALKFDLNDNWTILPQIMGQVSDTEGDFSYNPAVGVLETNKYLPEYTHDSWVQSALTVTGKIGDFDLVYSGAYLTRNTHEAEDYTDYALYYHSYFPDNAGNLINPTQYIIGRDHYTKLSNELRVSSPQSYWLRGTAGVFVERQSHYILQDYEVPGAGDPLGSVAPNDLSVPGWPGTIWLTDQVRTDRDQAAFTELTEDLIWSHPNVLTLTEGTRYYTYDNTLGGFYGFNSTYSSSQGTATCYPGTPVFFGAPCSDLNGRSTGSGWTPKVSLNYKVDPDKLLYVTWSKGYRPGGVNRNGGGTLPPYKPDYLTNLEVGWKTSWFNNSLRWNGALYREQWKDFQFSYLGPNALTIIANAGNAEVKGVETDLEWAVTRAFTLSGSATLLNAHLTHTYCVPPAAPNPNTCLDPDPAAAGNEQYAPIGTQLPVTPHFKGNITGRYNFPVFSYSGYVQGSAEYVGSRTADLRKLASEAFGSEPSYAIVDFAAGMQINKITAEFYVSNAFNRLAILDRFAECDVLLCGQVSIYNTPNQPRTVGLRFGQRF